MEDVVEESEPVEQEAGQDAVKAIETPAPSYLVEIAKSGQALCKKCDTKIEKKNLRIGVIIEGEWGPYTKYQHLHCCIFHKSLKSVEGIDGYKELGKEEKELVKARYIESQNEIDEDMLAINPDDLVRKNWSQPMEPSSNLLMPLLPYQKEGLGWMVHQEMNDVHGGILADEMGMGYVCVGVRTALNLSRLTFL